MSSFAARVKLACVMSNKSLVPPWLLLPAHGLAHWIEYQRYAHRDRKHSEGDFNTVLDFLIRANLPPQDNLVLKREVLYSALIDAPPELSRKHADFAIIDGEEQIPGLYAPAGVVEVKLDKAPHGKITDDLWRLAVYKRANPIARTFLACICTDIPRWFEVGTHVSIRGSQDTIAIVRCAVRAGTTYATACVKLVEVCAVEPEGPELAIRQTDQRPPLRA